MSTDPGEGVDTVRLPLAPMDDPFGRPFAPGGDTVAFRRLQRRVLDLERRLADGGRAVGA